MNVSIFLGSSEGNNPLFAQRVRELSRTLAENGLGMIFGGSNSGLMKIAADSFLEVSDDILGIEPDLEFIRKKVHPGLKNVIYTDSMAERKLAMIKRSDAVIVCPGGPGSLDEAGDVLQMLKVGDKDCPVVFLNTAGFYDPLKQLFANMQAEGFWGIEEERILFSDDINEILSFMKKPLPPRTHGGV